MAASCENILGSAFKYTGFCLHNHNFTVAWVTLNFYCKIMAQFERPCTDGGRNCGRGAVSGDFLPQSVRRAPRAARSVNVDELSHIAFFSFDCLNVNL